MHNEKNNSRKRGFFGSLVVGILSLLSLIGIFAMTLSMLNPYIDPQHFVWTSYFGLAFWEIFIFNLLVFFALLMMRSRSVWITILTLVISIPGFSKSFPFGKKLSDEGDFRVMTYNVHNFKHLDGTTSSEDFAQAIIEKVKEQNPDVLCCQEFSSFQKGVNRPKCIEIFAKQAGFPTVYYNLRRNYGGNVVFSKYPLEKVDEESGFGKENTYGTMVAVNAGAKGKLYVANLHLVSYCITDDEIDVLLESAKSQDSLEDIGKTIFHKLKFAFQRRSAELKEILETLPKVDGPIIMCGDFNDAPLSFTYRQMQKAGFTDSFIKVGQGIKPTYCGRLPLLRIDYVWGNDDIIPLKYKRLRFKASDHYPIILDFNVNNLATGN